jgi:hypothetical protein
LWAAFLALIRGRNDLPDKSRYSGLSLQKFRLAHCRSVSRDGRNRLEIDCWRGRLTVGQSRFLGLQTVFCLVSEKKPPTITGVEIVRLNGRIPTQQGTGE